MSRFYMNAGIDTGEILAAKEYPRPVFPKDAVTRFGTEPIIKALLQVFDPILRGRTLINVVKNMEEKGLCFEDLPSLPQDSSEGRTYYFMHERMMARLAEILCSGEDLQCQRTG